MVWRGSCWRLKLHVVSSSLLQMTSVSFWNHLHAVSHLSYLVSLHIQMMSTGEKYLKAERVFPVFRCHNITSSCSRSENTIRETELFRAWSILRRPSVVNERWICPYVCMCVSSQRWMMTGLCVGPVPLSLTLDECPCSLAGGVFSENGLLECYTSYLLMY